jgi:hypothetical protein
MKAMYAKKNLGLFEFMKVGHVYRREELIAFSNALDRHLQELTEQQLIIKAGPGLYYRPKQTRFGPLPADPKDVVKAFLKTDDFLITSLDAFNSLGVGLTQLVNESLVYNRKRVGRFVLDGQRYYFKRPTNFPKWNQVNKTFLFIDLLNNYDELLEPPDNIWSVLKLRVGEYPDKDLSKMAKLYGKESTKKMLKELTLNG